MRENIAGAVNVNGRRVVYLCSKGGLCLCSMHFKRMNVLKYPKVARGRDGIKN